MTRPSPPCPSDLTAYHPLLPFFAAAVTHSLKTQDTITPQTCASPGLFPDHHVVHSHTNVWFFPSEISFHPLFNTLMPSQLRRSLLPALLYFYFCSTYYILTYIMFADLYLSLVLSRILGQRYFTILHSN